MKGEQGNRLFLVVIILVTVLGGFLYWLNADRLNHDWNESLDPKSSEPYGLNLFAELLENATIDSVDYSSFSLKQTLEDGENYLFIGHVQYLKKSEADSLYEFVKRGNDAFISAEQMSVHLIQLLYGGQIMLPNCVYDTTQLYVYFYDYPEFGVDTDYVFTYEKLAEPASRHWCVDYSEVTFNDDNDSTEVLATANWSPGYWRTKVGDGYFYFHSNPITFTNLFVKDTLGYDHARKVFYYLDNKPIHWDIYSRVYHGEDENVSTAKSPLKYIFSQRSLRYAWYVLLFTILLFVLFRSKRQQRIIPIIPKTENTSIEFAKALGTFYYQSNDPKHIGEEMMSQFHNFNRRRYRIQRKKKSMEMVDEIAFKSKIKAEEIKEIFKLEMRVRYNDVAQMKDLVPLYQKLQNYYKNARK